MNKYFKKLLLGFVLALTVFFGRISAQTVNLNSHLATTGGPTASSNIYLRWYSVANPTPNTTETVGVNNFVGESVSTASPLTAVNVTATTTATNYYAFYYDKTNNCLSPGAKITVVKNTCPATQVDLNPLSVSTSGTTGVVLEWHNSPTPSASTLVGVDNGTTAINVGAGTYYTVFHDTVNNCYSPVSSPLIVAIDPCYCYKTGASSGTAITTTHGITALGRAGADNGNWPMVRQSAWTVLEAKTKGFVVNRIDNIPLDTPGNPGQVPTSVIASPIEGMMVYDIQNKCLKIYANSQWACFTKQTCPDY